MNAGNICTATNPVVACRRVAPSARMSADECLASSTVAQAMKTAFTAARRTSITDSTIVT